MQILRNLGLRKCARFLHCDSSSSYFLTTPIFYVNAGPHIGHLYTATLADAACRYQRMQGKNVLFSTGTDEHGLKIQQAALAEKLNEQIFCDKISSRFKELFDKSNISYTHFVRTSNVKHKEAVHYFWKGLKEKGHIYKGEYEGWYCVPEESFLTESQLVTVKNSNGEDIKVSAESGHPVQWTKETNYMFKLSNFQDDILNWLKRDGVVKPAVFQDILRHWLQEKIKDISVSRLKSRLKWGITVPEDDTQVIYVWLDALVNYLTVIGYPNHTKTNWPADCHVIGKDILKFHGIYWPAFLIASGLEPPKQLVCHSHWTVDNVKMSKSKGNVVCPNKLFEVYEPDILRYFLLRQGVPHSDGNFSLKNLNSYATSELADNLGNLLGRCTGTKLNSRQVFPEFRGTSPLRPEANDLVKSLTELPDCVRSSYEEYNFYQGIDEIFKCLRQANKFFEDSKPWEIKKKGSESELNSTLFVAMETLRVCGLMLQPILPSLTKRLLDRLGLSDDERYWKDCDVRFGRGEVGERTLGPSIGVLVNKEKIMSR